VDEKDVILISELLALALSAIVLGVI
jgi:hypothetical protein